MFILVCKAAVISCWLLLFDRTTDITEHPIYALFFSRWDIFCVNEQVLNEWIVAEIFWKDSMLTPGHDASKSL